MYAHRFVHKEGLLERMHGLYKEIRYLDAHGQQCSVHLPPMVLADSAFGLDTWQMTPYKGDTGTGTGPERTFNWTHSSARVVVEHAFGRLKGRFRLLLHTHRTSWRMGAQSVMAAMVLHNFLGMHDDLFLPDWAEGVEELEDERGADLELPNLVGNGEVRCAVDLKRILTEFFVQQGRRERRDRNR